MKCTFEIKDVIQITNNNFKKVDLFLNKYDSRLEYAIDEEDHLPMVVYRKDGSNICVFYNDYLCIGKDNQVYRISQEVFENLIKKKC